MLILRLHHVASPARCPDGDVWAYAVRGSETIINLSPAAALLMKPAPVLLDSTPSPLPKAPPGPSLLVELPAWHTVFLRNLFDLFRSDQDVPFKSSTPPGSFWPDVFVNSRPAWSRLGVSGLGHLAAIAAIVASIQFWPQRPEVVVNRVIRRDDVVYYSPSEYLPPLDTGGTRKPLRQKGEPAYAPQPIISVPAEADNHNQTIVTPFDLKLNHDVPLPNIVAWSQTKAQPEVPMASTTTAANLRLPTLSAAVVAPAPEVKPSEMPQRNPALSQAIVAPPQDVNGESLARTLQTPQASIIAPAPRIDAASARHMGDINIGHSTVVAPAPELPVAEQYAMQSVASVRAQSGASNTGPAVVPPAPSIAGNTVSNSGGRLISLGIHPAGVAPPETPLGNRRGTFAASPSGKTGAPGTPNISPDDNSGVGINSAAGKNSGVPAGLSVGAAPSSQATSTVVGNGNGSGTGGPDAHDSETSKLLADAKPPRVGSSPAASEIARDKATDVDRWIFGDRKFYAMTLNMPNFNSAGGSWVIRFAELNATDNKGSDSKANERKDDLTAPVATQKVDPAYPLELMQRNVHGTVTLYAVIRNDGSVTDVRVLRGVDDRLDEYAKAALGRWRFRPATRNGAPVNLEAVVMIPFRPVRNKSSF